MQKTRSSRMTTGIERHFKPLGNSIFREIVLHFIIFKDENGEVLSSKLDKTIEGNLYKEADQRSLQTNQPKVKYKFPDGTEKILVAL